MKINEVLSTVLPYEWDGDPDNLEDYGQANFIVNDKEYMVLFSNENTNEDRSSHWNIEFGLYPSKNTKYSSLTRYDITNTGDQFAVMSTVQAICKEWFHYHPTSQISMSANVPSRKKLYSRMLRNLLPNWNITVTGNTLTAEAPR